MFETFQNIKKYKTETNKKHTSCPVFKAINNPAVACLSELTFRRSYPDLHILLNLPSTCSLGLLSWRDIAAHSRLYSGTNQITSLQMNSKSHISSVTTYGVPYARVLLPGMLCTWEYQQVWRI